MNYVDLETAKGARGLRLVVGAHIASPWSEAAKGILHVKGIDYLAVRCEVRDPAVRAWTGVHNAPVAMYDDDPPRSGWAEILALAERLAPATPLVPADREQRLRLYGLAHELLSEGGMMWCARLLMIDGSLRSDGQRGFPVPLAQHFARKYGYAPDQVNAARARVRDVLAALARDLDRSRAAGSSYLIGDGLTAADIHAATALAPLAPFSDDLCPLQPVVRAMFSPFAEEMRPYLPEALLEHRMYIYRRHLELPIAL